MVGRMSDEFEWNPALPMDKEIAELMGKMDKIFHGYSRMVIVMACSRSIGAMFGPAQHETREAWLARFPGYMRSMWRMMDELWQ